MNLRTPPRHPTTPPAGRRAPRQTATDRGAGRPACPGDERRPCRRRDDGGLVTLTEITSTRTVPAFVRAVADAYGDRPAVTLGERALTYAALERESAALARGLLARG